MYNLTGKACAVFCAEQTLGHGAILIGKLAMDLPKTPRLRHLGFVSEEDKRASVSYGILLSWT